MAVMGASTESSPWSVRDRGAPCSTAVPTALTPSAVSLAIDIDVVPLAGTIGSRVDGVDISTPLDGEVIATLRAALVDRKVLVFPAQHPTPDALAAFGRRFGDLPPAHPVPPPPDALPPLDAENPEVLEIDATRSPLDARYREEYENDTWHTDVSFMANPPLGSL